MVRQALSTRSASACEWLIVTRVCPPPEGLGALDEGVLVLCGLPVLFEKTNLILWSGAFSVYSKPLSGVSR